MPSPPRPNVAPLVLKHVRLSRDEAVTLMRLAGDGTLADAERHLRMLRPALSPDEVHEVAWRCADPKGRGGIVTGVDPTIGPFADVAVTAG